VDVRPPETRAAAEALAGRRGSLVISEVFGGVGESGGLFTYHFGGYVALYNNSDTTIYLDGKIFGLGPPYGRDARTAINAMTCDDGASWQLDPEGLWSRFFWRIPGGGSEHPLPPGRSVVLATDAIDHRAVDSRLPDLSAADFEFIGPTDADNPTVPNLVSLGYYGDPSVQGHGLLIGYTSTVIYFVADSLNPASLPTARLPYVPELVPRVPRAKILDVFTSFLGPDWEIQAPLPACPRLVSSVFDQQAGSLLGFPRTDTTIIRKAIGQLPDGRWLLQRTKATAVDFALRKRGDAGQVP